MKAEQINLLKSTLLLEYYKEDIRQRYRTISSNIILDNEVLETFNERIYITKWDKHIKLEQQIKSQKKVMDKLEFIKNRKKFGCSQENINKMAIELVNNYLKEVLNER